MAAEPTWCPCLKRLHPLNGPPWAHDPEALKQLPATKPDRNQNAVLQAARRAVMARDFDRMMAERQIRDSRSCALSLLGNGVYAESAAMKNRVAVSRGWKADIWRATGGEKTSAKTVMRAPSGTTACASLSSDFQADKALLCPSHPSNVWPDCRDCC